MGGFKSGAADDDWGEETDDQENDTGGREDSQEPVSEPDPRSSRDATQEVRKESSTPQLPWIHRRNSITDGREKTVQLHLQESTVDTERSSKSDAEEALGESVSKADLREAALLVGLEHVDEVAELLKEWGYAIE